MSEWLLANMDILTYLGIYCLIMYMIFVITRICKESEVPRNGVIWIFIALGGGFTGWIAKDIIQLFL